MRAETEVAIVGAGAYGLSLAAQLRARGVSFRIFGHPMTFWRGMPIGVNLKSLAFATNIYVPEPGFTFPEWCRERGLEDWEPCTMQSYAAYGMWMQERFVPDLEQQNVRNVAARPDGGFQLTLEDGELVRARRVVLATGLTHFKSVPEALVGLPPELASHTFDLHDYAVFRGKRVAVLGAGASAIEAGALILESGGDPVVLVREGGVLFHGRTDRDRPLWERVREPMTVLGGGRKQWLLQEFPWLIHFVPEERRVRFVKRFAGPASPWWIKDRVEGKVAIELDSEVVAAVPAGGRVRLTVRGPAGSRQDREFDHVIAGTGYVVDVDRIAYLEPELRRQVRRTDLAPALSINFESSVAGLYFVGPSSAMSFGPLFRFVAGADFTVKMVARHIAGPVTEMKTSVQRLRAALSRMA